MDTPSTIPPRPDRYDDAVLAEAVEMLLSRIVVHYCGSPMDEGAKAWHRRHLLTVLDDHATDPDGYAMARDLDSMGWAVDAGLVRILDGTRTVMGQIHDQKVEAWVKAHQPEKRFTLGDRVAWVDEVGRREAGRIVGNCPDTACYVIQPPDWKGGPTGMVVEYERVEAAG